MGGFGIGGFMGPFRCFHEFCAVAKGNRPYVLFSKKKNESLKKHWTSYIEGYRSV